MRQSDAARPGPNGVPHLHPTILVAPDRPAESVVPTRPKPRCRMTFGSGSTPQLQKEIACLLHSRLRLVVFIILAPSLVFLTRHLFELPQADSLQRWAILFNAAVALLAALLAALLWGRSGLGLRTLRGIELALFGSLAAFFAWLQYEGFAHCPLDASASQPEHLLWRLAAQGGTARWFFLVVIYGVFIPNTWRRCALVTGGAVALAMGVTALAWIGSCRSAAELASILGDMSTLLLTGVAVAVFGTYRLHVLQQEAFEAKQLGQYRLKERLGAGGMGEVYLAEHVLLRRPCAIKLIRPEQAGDGTALQRFEREVQAMATLTHWNTVEVFDYGRAEDGTFYYVMEYLPGLNLDTLVTRHGPLPAARVVHFLRQVCRALREAHGVGLLHRDIKPSNVIACERGGVYDVAKLLDFGLVQESGLPAGADRLTIKGSIVGSPPFMSPEQAAARPGLDARSDVYSLGAVAYFLLTGQPPFLKESALEMLMAHAYERVVPPTELRPDVPADVQAVVLRCLEKDAARRFPDADSLERALAACACAGEWDEDQAAAWWRQRPVADTATHSLGVATAPVA